MKNGAIDLSQAGAELKFKIDPITGGGGADRVYLIARGIHITKSCRDSAGFSFQQRR